MTRDEILNMPAGREMDALIAEKVMGWILHPHKTHWMIYEGDINNTLRPKYRNYGDFLPSTDISAAWEVVEKLSKLHDVVVSVYGGLTSCKILREVKHDWKFEMIVEQIYESAPLAVCRASLLAVMGE